MNQRLFAEFTALVASQAPLVIESPSLIPDGPLWVYWQYSQSALRGWQQTLLHDKSLSDAWRLTQQLDAARQTFVSEMLTRVWGAILTASDLHHGVRRAEPIAIGVLNAHQQCRLAALKLIAQPDVADSEPMADLDRLRRRVERWTDLLLGPLVVRYGERVERFAFDLRRASEFGHEPTFSNFSSIVPPAWAFLIAGLQSAFPDRPPASQSWPIHLLPIVRSVLATFPSDAFEASGLVKSLRSARMARSSQMIERPLTLTRTAGRLLRRDQ